MSHLRAMEYLNSPAFSSRVEELIKKHHIPGLSVAFVEGDRTFSAAYGLATLDPPKPCTPDTLFDIASSSKSMTAAAVGLLVRDDEKYPEVKWEAKMSSLLPGDFIMSKQEYTDDITVDDILSHRTGLPRHDDSYLGPLAAKPDDARSVTRNLRNLEVTAPIRSKFMYCNIMFTVATYLVEQKSGLAFADFLQEHFFKPLEMHSTQLQPARAKSFGLGDRISTGYHWDEKSERYIGFDVWDSPEDQGAGSIITSASDYLKWVKALMNQDHPIDEEIYKGLIRMRSFTEPDPEDGLPLTSPEMYAAGLEVFYYRGHMVISHDGGIPGYGSRHFFVPSLKLGGVILGNTDATGTLGTILAYELIDEALGVPSPERMDWNKVLEERNAKYENDPKEEELRRVLREDAEAQKMPLSIYTGTYWNPGYKGMTVEIKDGKLYIDASDRSIGFFIVLDHVRGETEYLGHVSNWLSRSEYDLWPARFLFHNDKPVKFGLELEKEAEMIWFDRIE
ncbi:beta-lactamase family protein [Xylaria bambusicola]|uniref:beta-lactamase family protein n=1 Tax=Xylaria bambusicola TaxID=326684 RepID=UPI0020083702|nr:beta-lactamase family protein [Xylaria bambusicola]KAI0512874.1 beta-lactamase family protein [Xylaria bambusicola]